jgi:hypothetical protein
MLLMLKFEKADIKTVRFGENFAIQAPAMRVIFTPEAAQKFFDDVWQITTGNDSCHTEALDALRQWAVAEATGDQEKLQNARVARDKALEKVKGSPCSPPQS